MPGRHTNNQDYRFGYNGMEKDPEMKGDGNSYTTEFRQYDPRLGRWLSLDPLMAQLEKWSPYVAFENNPVIYNDPLGLKVKKGSGSDVPTEKHESGEDWSENDEWKNTTTGETYVFGNGQWNKRQDLKEFSFTHKRTFLQKLTSSCKKVIRICTTAISSIPDKVKSACKSVNEKVNKLVYNAVKFVEVVVYTVASNNCGGAGRLKTDNNYSIESSAQNTGDVITIVQGAVEMAIGGGVAAGGSLATAGSGGTAAPVSVPVAAEGIAIIAHGGTLISTTVSNMITDEVDATTSSNQNGADVYENPGHHDPNGGTNNYDPNKSVIPDNAAELWEKSIRIGKNYWTKVGEGKDAVYHRFSGGERNGNWHWTGCSKGFTKSGAERSIDMNNFSSVKKILQ